jgi:hypothetical protein
MPMLERRDAFSHDLLKFVGWGDAAKQGFSVA